ncbi:protein-L-isoaspartate O-methyltransferase [Halobacteriales archaeon QS_4_69_34]|nr:MAG: protein-L-isoaspartate O-methyltransferase [Halobacteriales archaeon QS_4_69_34]
MEPAALREDMVAGLEHESKGVVRSAATSVAMRAVPREAFVAEEAAAYADRASERLGTRVLAPSTVARLIEALAPEPDSRVLVVGAGVGYTAAVCAAIVGEANVHAVDIARRLVGEARANLRRAGYGGVLVDRRDGSAGLPEYAPFDRILVEAAAVRPPRALVDQLAPGGRLVLPLGAREQTLTVVAPTATEDGAGTAVDRGATDEPTVGTRGPETGASRENTAIEGTVDTAGGAAVAERLGTVAFAPLLVEGERADTVERNRTRREDREHARRVDGRRRGWEHDWIDWDRRG